MANLPTQVRLVLSQQDYILLTELLESAIDDRTSLYQETYQRLLDQLEAEYTGTPEEGYAQPESYLPLPRASLADYNRAVEQSNDEITQAQLGRVPPSFLSQDRRET